MSFHDEVFGDPVVSPGAFVDPEATLIGRVIIDGEVLVGPKAALRADEGTPFRVCSGSNIQDGVILHGHHDQFVEGPDGSKYSIYVGRDTTVAHRAMLHGPLLIVGGNTFVGAAAILWGSSIGEGCIIRTSAKIENAKIGSGCLIGVNATIVDVEIPPGKYIPSHTRVIKQSEVAALEDVRPEQLEKFRNKNNGIRKVNRKLVQQHKERSLKRLEYEREMAFKVFQTELEERIALLASHPGLMGKSDQIAIATAVMEVIAQTKTRAMKKNGTGDGKGKMMTEERVS